MAQKSEKKKKNPTDVVIQAVLTECFKEPDRPVPLAQAREWFYEFIDSDVQYFAKLRTFEMAYDRQFTMVRKGGIPMKIPEPSERTLVFLYVNLIQSTLMDPDITTYATGSEALLGSMSPRLYALMVLLSSISTPRFYNDNMLQVCLAGKSSVGKSRILHPLAEASKSFAMDSKGVGRFESADHEYSFLFHDFLYAKLVSQSDISTIKNMLRSERTCVKIKDRTISLKPSYVLLTSNEVLFRHTSESEPHQLITYPSHTVPAKLSSEHLDSLKNRILEVYFRKQSTKVNPAVFNAEITLKHAKIALSIIVLKELKNLSHPIKIPSSLLIPCALWGIKSIQEKICLYLDVTESQLLNIVQTYETIYVDQANERISELGTDSWPEKFDY